MPSRLPAVFGDQALYLMRLMGDMQLHCVVSLDGRIDEGRLSRAMRLVMDAEPVVGCRYELRWWKPRWVRREDLDGLTLCEVREIGPSDRLEREVRDYLADPTDPCVDPMLTAKILRLGNGTDTVCFKLNHLMADAGGTKELMYLLASIYNNLGKDPAYRPEPNLRGRRTFRQLKERFGFKDRLKIWRRAARNHRMRVKPRVHWSVPTSGEAKGPEAPGRTYLFLRVGPDTFRAIRAFGLERNATINDVVVAALYRALLDELRPGPDVPLRMITTADLRRYLKTGQAEAICNLSGFVYLNLGTGPDLSFEELVDRVRDQMTELKADMIGLGDSVVLPAFLRAIPFGWLQRVARRLFLEKPPAMHLEPGLTNMGRIDPARLVFQGLNVRDAFLTPSVAYPPYFILGMTGFGESLTIEAGFCESGFDREMVARLFERMGGLFRQVGGGMGEEGSGEVE